MWVLINGVLIMWHVKVALLISMVIATLLFWYLELEWASINLGIVICIKCSGVHRGLGTHVSKVKSLNLDKWDRAMVDFMQSQGNAKSNSYYESTLGEGLFTQDIKKPTTYSSK